MKRPAPWRIRRLVEGEVVVGWVVEQLLLVNFTPAAGLDVAIEGEYAVVEYFENGEVAIGSFAEASRTAL
ncbi:hypothetical protein SEA_NIKLAS_63 [Mycobacterium Phage Niklas]|uniref:Uncharacterized protein n=1 Tax=Mycobacterium Phage Niklas TaxID=2517936 RepID=A0A482JGF8_9CAUD|nr:hypothetical protein I5H04_gp40 [Mycobacterium Phage Niklas]ASR85947.1 hypothetical protein SEA_PEANAM_63 [Mycobacterium phage Peanam]QAY02794.1 hypothetical protein SEA_SHAOBING_63 [Mycobacterium phage Shaobing]QBP31645.1 hypothetical protein SEA_NIKLAS_63 [Mycobacterium Phage Niklas]